MWKIFKLRFKYQKRQKIKLLANYGLKNGGVHLVGSKNHGKTYLLFNLARELQKKARIIIFDGSGAWFKRFGKINVFTVFNEDITMQKPTLTIEYERFKLENEEEVKFVLENYRDVFFFFNFDNPYKRGYFIRKVVDLVHRKQKQAILSAKNEQTVQPVCFIVEEAQNAFTSHSTARYSVGTFRTQFNEARNFKEAFFTTSQRLTDFSKTIRTKQAYCIGKINFEDISGWLRRIERQFGLDFSKLPKRTWYFNGFTFKSPDYKKQGKPRIINKEVEEALKPKEKPKKKSFWQKLKDKLSIYAEDLLESTDLTNDDFEDSSTEIEEDFSLYDD